MADTRLTKPPAKSPRPPRRHLILPRLSIRLVVPLVLALPTALACVTLIATSFYRSRTAIDRLTLESFSFTHDRITTRLDQFLTNPVEVNRLNATLLRSGRLDLSDLNTWRDVLHQQTLAFGTISCLSWDGADGRHAWITRYPRDTHLRFAVNNDANSRRVVERRCNVNGSLQDGEPKVYDIDPREFIPFKTGSAAGKPEWTESFEWVNEDGSFLTVALAHVHPMYDQEHKLQGVLTAQLTLYDIALFLTPQQPSLNSHIFIIDAKGRLLADSRRRPDAEDNRAPAPVDGLSDPVVAAAVSHLQPSEDDEGWLSKRQSHLIDFQGQPWLLVASPFQHRSGLRWVIVTFAPESDFLEDLEQARHQGFFIVGGITLVMITAGLLLAAGVMRPMLLIKDYLRRLGEGDLEARIDLPYALEFVQISNALNLMVGQLKSHLRLQRDLAVAEQVQKSLLPARVPSVPGLDMAAVSLYCEKTGGDYYDFMYFPEAAGAGVTIAVGDVMGHGLPAAMLMASARGIIRSRRDSTESLSDILRHANRHVLGDGDANSGRFMTMLLVALENKGLSIRWSSAGHDAPIVYDPESDKFVDMPGGDLPLGVMPDTDYGSDASCALKRGTIVVLGTDGLWESRSPQGERFGKGRVKGIVRAMAKEPAAKIVETLVAGAESHRAGGSLEDDLTVVVVKVL